MSETVDLPPPPQVELPLPSAGATVDLPPEKSADPSATVDLQPDEKLTDTAEELKQLDPSATMNLDHRADAEDDSFACDSSQAGSQTMVREEDSEEQEDATGPERPTVAGYEILGELGRGGMGVVYKARQIKLNRIVALKMVLAGAHAGKDQLARFYTEAQAVAHLQHPNIIQIYEVSEHAGLPYFSLEFLDGGCLADKTAGKPQPEHDAAHIVETLARAMHYAHEHGVVHRDLKPANILLTAGGVPKITDFGLAKRLEGESSSQTRDGAILGTPSYMAPEQALGEIEKIGPLTDVYALGAMLYELLTGRPPFLAATPMDTVIQVTRDEPVPLSQLQPTVPRDLETICLKCLQKEQAKRYPTAGELADDLRRFLAGEPIKARPVSAPERFWRWCRRNPKIAGLSAAVALLLVTVAVVSSSLAIQIAHERDQTELERREAVKARDFAKQKEQEAEEARDLAHQKAKDEEAAKLLAQQAEKKASESAKVASDQRRLSLDTLRSLVTKVEEKLRDKEDMGPLRQDIIKTAMDGLQQVSRSAENASLADRSVGVAHQRMGDIHEQVGETEEAIRQYNLSLAVFDKLLAQDPNDAKAKFAASVSYDKLGGMVRDFSGDAATALDRYNKSLQLRLELADPNIKDLPLALKQKALAVSYIKLADLNHVLGNPEMAREHARKSLEQSEASLAADAKDGQAKQFVAFACFVLGKANVSLQEIEAARAYYDRSFELRQELADEDPLSVAAKRDLGTGYDALGDLELSLTNHTAAREHYQKGREIREGLYEKDPRNAEVQWDLSYSYYHLGIVAELLGDSASSKQAYRRCLVLREALAKADPKSVQRMAELMLIRARCGQHQQASQTADELFEREPASTDILFSVARGYALCAAALTNGRVADELTPENKALRQRYTDRATESLARGITDGYRDMGALKSEPDLDSVRNDTRVQELVEWLQQR